MAIFNSYVKLPEGSRPKMHQMPHSPWIFQWLFTYELGLAPLSTTHEYISISFYISVYICIYIYINVHIYIYIPIPKMVGVRSLSSGGKIATQRVSFVASHRRRLRLGPTHGQAGTVHLATLQSPGAGAESHGQMASWLSSRGFRVDFLTFHIPSIRIFWNDNPSWF